MTHCILITSLKGGVGKTTVCANLAMALARKGHTVIAVDCDTESRCLDMILGLESSALYDISDVLSGRCGLEDAVVCDDRCERLSFLASPSAFFGRDSEEFAKVFSRENIDRLVASLRERYEFILFDLPAHPDVWYDLLLGHTDTAVVVAMHTAVSVRSAEKTAMSLLDRREKKENGSGGQGMPSGSLKIRLVINGFKPREIPEGIRSGVYDIISKTSIRLLGVIPYSEAMAAAQESGKLSYQLYGGRLIYTAALDNIADRLCGENVPLLSGVLSDRARKKVL